MYLKKKLMITVALACLYPWRSTAVSDVVPSDDKSPSRLEFTETVVWVRQRTLNRMTGLR